MSKKSNKVKFGLKNCHYAKATFDEDGSVTYAKPVRIPGAVSLSMDANGEIEPFYADNIAYYVVNNNSGYEGDLEIALIPESFLTDIMHEELDGNGVLAENANVELEHFAFLFEFDGDQRHIRHVLYNCVASRPSIEGETNEDSKEVKTDTLNLQATPLANGYVKAKTGTNTTDDVYNKWYDAVYEPQAEAVIVQLRPDLPGQPESVSGVFGTAVGTAHRRHSGEFRIYPLQQLLVSDPTPGGQDTGPAGDAGHPSGIPYQRAGHQILVGKKLHGLVSSENFYP